MKLINKNHQWDRYTALRALLAAGSLASMVLASGAGWHWG